MAPFPEPQGDEPKAPDKSSSSPDDTGSSREDGATARDDADANRPTPVEELKDPDTSDNVSNLNDGQLKALLDEAITYKSPRDRHGKSEIFNELLKKAETAEEEGGPDNSVLFQESRFVNSKRRSGRREKGISVSERQSSYRSLQNINQCHQGDPATLSGRRHGPHQFRRGASTSSTCSSVTSESVSTRQREGGSLPCSVNEVQLINFTQGAYNGDSSSTRASLEDLHLRWSSNSSMHKLPAGQHESSSRGSPKPAAHSPVEMITFDARDRDSGGGDKETTDKKDPRSKIVISQALQQEKQAIMDKARQESERENACAMYKNTVNLEVNQNEADDAEKHAPVLHDNILKLYSSNNIYFAQETFELQTHSTAVSSVLENQRTTTSIAQLQNTKTARPIGANTQPATRLYTGYSQKVDENENMQSSHSESASTIAKKKKKKHLDASVKSEAVEGYIGDKDLDYIIKYIGVEQKNKGSKLSNDLKHKETKDPKHGEATANRRSQRYSEDGKKDQQKKVGRKSSGETGRHKMKRANSLEEVSKSKLEDLTIQPYCRSIGGEDRTSEVSKDLDDEDEEYNRLLDEHNGNVSVKSEDFQGNLTGSDFPDLLSDSNPVPNEDSLEFQMVTNSKKQRRKKQKVRQDDRTGRHSYIRGGGMDYEEDHYPHHHHHHHHYPHHPPVRRKLKSTCSVPPSDQSGGDSSDCDSVHSLPVSHVAASNSESSTKSYAAIARNPAPLPPPPPIAVAASDAKSVDEWPQVFDKADGGETASSSVSSTTTEPNTPPEEAVNVLQDYYPSLAESVKGGRKSSEEPEGLPNGDVAKRPAATKAASPPATTKGPWKATQAAAEPLLPPPPPKRVTQNQPPVIFDEKTLCSDSVEGLTFGFSVNPSLMDEAPAAEDCPAAPANPPPPHVPLSPKPPLPPQAVKQQQSPPKTAAAVAAAAPSATAPAGESQLPTCNKTRDFAAMFRPPTLPQSKADALNQSEIVNFVGNTWGSVLYELKNKESPNSRSIQYYSAEF